jgi:CubicO group peptidase (beta-lactamase class C family)
MKLNRTIRFFALLVVLSTAATVARAQEGPGKDFDDYVNKALKDWEVPGLAISIVKDDKVIFAKGYGVRKLGDPTPVDEKTMFAIGSASKAFTAASIAMLVDEGKLKWDDPATKNLPGFQLYDPYATRELTVRDLLCHRSGLERGDFLWYGAPYSRDEILRRVRYLKPTWSFRSMFGYQNIMYLAAGQTVAAVSGKSWDEFVKQRIFTPLGMTSSNTTIRDLAGNNAVASPHAKIDDKVTVIQYRNIDNIAPAGSINSNVLDMAQWVRLQLGEGKFGKDQLISSGGVKEMHQPQTIIRQEPPWSLIIPQAHFLSYGLGWFLHDHNGRKVIQHGGNIDGMSALVAMIPEEKLGVVILTNMNGTEITAALAYTVFDWYTNGPKRDWSADMLKTIKEFEAQGKAAQKKIEDARVLGTKPSLALDKYAGGYKDDMYGDAKVTLENGKLVLTTPSFVGDLEHWHYDTFRVTWRQKNLGKAFVNFTLDPQGKIETMRVADLELSFKRVVEAAPPAKAVAVSESDLKRLTGKYVLENAPLEVGIEVVGGKLKASVPGQPVYTLIPVSATRYQIEGAPAGYFVNFEVQGEKVVGMTIEQGPALTLKLRPKQ